MHAPIPLFYVLGDLRVLTPAEVMHYGAIEFRQPAGSYYFISTHQAHHFDEVFGTVQSLTA